MTMKQLMLKSLKKALAGKKLLTLAITSSAVVALSASFTLDDSGKANAMPPAELASNIQTMQYQLYAGGINAVKASVDISYENKERYSLELFAETQGFLGSLVPWSGTFETHGWRLNDGSEKPELHKSTSTWDGEEDLKEYKYGKDGSFKSLKVVEAGEDKSPEDLDSELVQGTTDALTATLQAMKAVAEKGTCEGEDEVFDGKRRFKMVFRHKADDQLTPSKYNVYEGLAARCEVEVVPISGAWHKKPRGWASIQEQGREKGSLPTVWLASIDEEGPAVPVKLRVKTDYGTLFMHLVEYQNGDKQIKASDD